MEKGVEESLRPQERATVAAVMKRSPGIALVAMATLALTACGDGGPQKVWADEATCETSGAYSAEDCRKLYRQAMVRHRGEAPGYGSLEDCEGAAQWERCERDELPTADSGETRTPSATGGGGAFLYRPAFSGFTPESGVFRDSGAPAYRTKAGMVGTASRVASPQAQLVARVFAGRSVSIGGAGSAHAASGHGSGG